MATSLGLTFTQASDLGSVQNQLHQSDDGERACQENDPNCSGSKMRNYPGQNQFCFQIVESPHEQSEQSLMPLPNERQGNFVKDNIINMLQCSGQCTERFSEAGLWLSRPEFECWLWSRAGCVNLGK